MIPPSLGTTQVAVPSDSKVTQGEEKCEGLEPGKTWGRKWQEVGSRAAPASFFSYPDPVKTPYWHKHRNLSVFPRAQGLFWGTAPRGQKGVGLAVKFDFRS